MTCLGISFDRRRKRDQWDMGNWGRLLPNLFYQIQTGHIPQQNIHDTRIKGITGLLCAIPPPTARSPVNRRKYPPPDTSLRLWA